MPSHPDDIRLIANIKTNITTQITSKPNHTFLLCGGFNHDIALIGRIHNNQTTPPQPEDLQWRHFTNSLNLTYIPTDTNYSRQGGLDYKDLSLIDRFYILHTNYPHFTSSTKTNLPLNSDYSPIQLNIPHNTLFSRTPPPFTNKNTRILNPISKENANHFITLFFEEIQT